MAPIIHGNDQANTISGTTSREVIYGFDPDGPQGNVAAIDATRIATGLTQPIFVASPPGDLDRMFVVSKTGVISIFDLGRETLKPTPFLDVSAQISTTGERGLLGLAFDPDFKENGFFYVNLINLERDTEIRRYQVSPTSNVVDPDNYTMVMTVDQPEGRTNHKSGWLGFGPDGMLYVPLGDGGGSGDPLNNAQNPDVLLGKMLRLDVSADQFPGDPSRNYTIPDDNPFVGATQGADEIFALGLRNPWRPSFDRGAGTLYIADVGQGRFEEINIGTSGANYGWKLYEGNSAYSSGTPTIGDLTFPVHVYDHSVGESITGGYVYRGPSEGLHGHYFFADFVLGGVFTLHRDGGDWTVQDRTGQIVANAGTIDNPSSFGEDAQGNLYLVDYDGDIFRLTPRIASADAGDTIRAGGGDDLVFGGSGNDRLNGGSGEDELQGGAGNDRLYGSSGADLLLGGDGDDVLNGGTNGDIMSGGAGSDTYLVNSTADRVYERDVQGVDRVVSDVSFSLARQFIENLTLSGSSNLNGTGNTLANVIAGNAGANELLGGKGNDTLHGGGGSDKLYGGTGNDTYHVAGPDARVFEDEDEGIDHVVSNADFSLSRQFIENLSLTGAQHLDATGNTLDNVIKGNTGANRIYGGRGVDDLYAGVDNKPDVFAFGSYRDSPQSGGAWDRIFEFDRKDWAGENVWDKIDLTAFAIGFSDLDLVNDGEGLNVGVDTNGNDRTDLVIQVMNVSTLTADDFLF